MHVASVSALAVGDRLREMKVVARGSRAALCAQWPMRSTDVVHKRRLPNLACAYFHVTSPDDLTTAIYAPTITNERLAGFGRDVVNAAKDEDQVALQIVADGGTELGRAAVAVIRHLQMERDRFQIAYVGGVFRAAGDLMLDTLREEVRQVAPRAFFEPPHFAPAVAAARMARERFNHIALAV